MKKRTISLVCALLFLFAIIAPLSSFATESESEEPTQPTLKELCDLAERAVILHNVLAGSYSLWWEQINEGGRISELSQWLISLGYFSEDSVLKTRRDIPTPILDRHTGEEYPVSIYDNTYARSLPKEITMERLKKDYFDLFYYDMYEFFYCCSDHIVHGQPGGLWCCNNHIIEDTDGTIFILATEHFNAGDAWIDLPSGQELEDFAEFLYQSDDCIVMALYEEERTWYATVEFRKNADGWRVYGGTAYDHNGTPPPETSDNTPIFVALIALPTIGLGVLSVKVRRKRKEKVHV